MVDLDILATAARVKYPAALQRCKFDTSLLAAGSLIVGSLSTMTSAYFYSTKRSGQAIALNIVRSLVMNSLIITFLPKIFGNAIVWHTFGIYEVLALILAVALTKGSERNGIVYK